MKYFYVKNNTFKYYTYVNACVNYTHFSNSDIVTSDDLFINGCSDGYGVSINDTDDLVLESTGFIVCLTNLKVIAQPMECVEKWEFKATRNSNLSIDGAHWDISININGEKQFEPKPINELIIFFLKKKAVPFLKAHVPN